MTPYQNVIIPKHHPCKHDWRTARLTELTLMGHSWKSVQHILNISKPEFDQLLDDAIEQAKAQQAQMCRDYLERECSNADAA